MSSVKEKQLKQPVELYKICITPVLILVDILVAIFCNFGLILIKIVKLVLLPVIIFSVKLVLTVCCPCIVIPIMITKNILGKNKKIANNKVAVSIKAKGNRYLISLSSKQIVFTKTKIKIAAMNLSNQISQDIKHKNKQFNETEINYIQQRIEQFILIQKSGQFEINIDEKNLKLNIEMKLIDKDDIKICAELFMKNSN